MKKQSWITLGIIFLVIVIAFVIIYLKNNSSSVEPEVAKCIGSKSILYSKLGCTHCETQKKMFGDSYQYLTVVDCFYEKEICLNASISGTPTWIVDGKQYIGVQEIETLQRITGC